MRLNKNTYGTIFNKSVYIQNILRFVINSLKKNGNELNVENDVHFLRHMKLLRKYHSVSRGTKRWSHSLHMMKEKIEYIQTKTKQIKKNIDTHEKKTKT